MQVSRPRIYLMPPGHSRRLWIEFENGPWWPVYRKYLVRLYCELRRGGLEAHRARWMMYDILHAGRFCELGPGYNMEAV